MELELPDISLDGEGLEEISWATVPIIGSPDEYVAVYPDGSWGKWLQRLVTIPAATALALVLLTRLAPLMDVVSPNVA